MEELALQFLTFLPRYGHIKKNKEDLFDGKSSYGNELDFVISPTLTATVKYEYFKTKDDFQLDMYALQSLSIKFSENDEYYYFDIQNLAVGYFFYVVVASRFSFVPYDQIMENLYEEMQKRMIVR